MTSGAWRVAIGRRSLPALLAIAFAACTGPVPSPTATPTSSPVATPSATPTGAGPARSPSPGPTSAATPIPPDWPLHADPDALTRICEEPPDGDLDDVLHCGGAIEAALRALGTGARAVGRADFAYGPVCPPGAPCPLTPDAGHVVFWWPARPLPVVRVALDEYGAVVAYPPEPLPFEPPPAPAIVSPPAARPDVGEMPPPEVAGRAPYPYCGHDGGGLIGPLDRVGRRCFVESVLAGKAAEFIVRLVTVEGDPATDVWRFAGSGPIVVFVDQTQDTFSAGGWLRLTCSLVLDAEQPWELGRTDCTATPLS